MLPLPIRSPFDGGRIIITRFYCPDSDIVVKGEFEVTTPLAQLNTEQIQFVETFVRCEGKLNRVEGELGISYPTIRSRLHEVIRALGYEPGKDEPAPAVPDRKRILEALNSGDLSFDEAMEMLAGNSVEPKSSSNTQSTEENKGAVNL
jgi:hypothetical protein